MAGRPTSYPDSTRVGVNSSKARSRLQKGSERRAIVDRIIDSGGEMTIGQLCESFGYDLRGKVGALIRVGWLEVSE